MDKTITVSENTWNRLTKLKLKLKKKTLDAVITEILRRNDQKVKV